MDGEKIKIEVEIPVGYDLVINGTDCKLVPKPKLPKTWKEFCETPVQKGECCLTAYSNISEANVERLRMEDSDKVMLPDKKTAEAFLALMQLIQLRNRYNGDWVPDWSNTAAKWVIAPCSDNVQIYCNGVSNRVLSFKTKEICGQFFENFRDLIETAKPLI